MKIQTFCFDFSNVKETHQLGTVNLLIVIQKSNQRATALDNTNCCLFQNYGTAVAGNVCFHDT